jgi:Glycosyl transferase family 2
MSFAARTPAAPAPAASVPSVDVVVPVHNEQGILPASIRRLHEYLSAELPLDWRIVIADNASTDETLRIAMALAADLPAGARCGRRGSAARPTSSATWTPTCRPTCARSRRC